VLEPDEGKLSSPVLRGLSGRKAARLPGEAHLRGEGGRVRKGSRRAFDKAVRRKPLALAADAVYGFLIDFCLELIARSGIQQKRCY
jgi:hypothetical protein